MRKYILSSTAFHFAILFLVLFSPLFRPKGPIMIIDGFDYARVAFIISDKYQEIGDAIMHDMVRGATSIKTRGLYRNIEREMIMTVTTMKEVPALTDKIKEIDPTAFIVIANAHEVLGQGFRRRL